MIMIKKEKPAPPPPSSSMTYNFLHPQQPQLPWVSTDFFAGIDVGMAGSVGRQSPMNSGPDVLLSTSPSSSSSFTNANGGSPSSPSVGGSSFTIGSSVNYVTSPNNDTSSTIGSPNSYPPNHPLGASKHLCSICEDKASGKHYGVYSCEGCKGFFKRTVRKNLTYKCREGSRCIIDKRQRNRCQDCRYKKCLDMGMKREAVQEERQRTKGEKVDTETALTNNAVTGMPVSRILDAELIAQPQDVTSNQALLNDIFGSSVRQLEQLMLWAKHIPHFVELPLEDQTRLLKTGWNELLIATISHQTATSLALDQSLMLMDGQKVIRSMAEQIGLDAIYDRIFSELVSKMREMKIDKTEVGCLKAIVLYNHDAKDLVSKDEVENLRDKVYAALEDYTKTNYPDQPRRFAKLLLRLPALRSLSLQCKNYYVFYNLISDTPIETYLKKNIRDNSVSLNPS